MKASWILAPIVGLLLAVSALSRCSDGEVKPRNEHYATRKQAEAAGTFGRGWLPQSLPASAYNIRVSYYVDTNEVWMRFQYVGNDLLTFLDQCNVVDDPDFPKFGRTQKLARWWPKALTASGRKEQLADIRVYHCAKMQHGDGKVDSHVAVSQSQLTVWYWLQ